MQNHQDAARTIRALMNTPDGKRLMTLLGSDGGKALRAAANAMQQGNEAKAQESMAPLLNNQEVQALLTSLNRKMNYG